MKKRQVKCLFLQAIFHLPGQQCVKTIPTLSDGVKGFQGKDLIDNKSILACAKHSAVYGAAQAGNVTRPVKELKGFKKIYIKKGETVPVTFTIPTGELAYFHENMSYTPDPGKFQLFIGPNSSEGLVAGFSIL